MAASPIAFLASDSSPFRIAENKKHVRMHPSCGACGFLFLDKDSSVTICVSNHDGGITRYSLIDTLFFQGSQRSETRGNTKYCCSFPCADCDMSNETATIHPDCWQLYAANIAVKGRLYRLYHAATARQPWKNCWPLPIEPGYHGPSVLALAARLQLGALTQLPWEIQDAIAAELGTSPLLRFSAVLELVKSMSAAIVGSVPTTPISLVQAWSRGTLPVLSKEPLTTPAIVTMDSMGINAIRRSQLPMRKISSGKQAFITGSNDLRCRFQDGTCRVGTPATEGQQQIWKVPNPPNPQDCSEFLMPLQTFAFVIDLPRCSGLTFFISEGLTRRIHAHTKAMPTAVATIQQIPLRLQHEVSWVYVPLPSADDLVAVGVRDEGSTLLEDSYTFYFRTALLGDFTIGPWVSSQTSTQAGYATSSHSKLVHTISDLDLHEPAASFSHVYPRSRQCTDFSPMPPQSSPAPFPDDRYACYSSVALTGVCAVWIYRDRSSRGSLQGLIFDYNSGAQRAMGSCRLGVDPVERCEVLADVRFRLTEIISAWGYRRSFVSIETCVASEHEEDEETEWTRLAEGCTLEMWFDYQSMVLNMVPAAM